MDVDLVLVPRRLWGFIDQLVNIYIKSTTKKMCVWTDRNVITLQLWPTLGSNTDLSWLIEAEQRTYASVN